MTMLMKHLILTSLVKNVLSSDQSVKRFVKKFLYFEIFEIFILFSFTADLNSLRVSSFTLFTFFPSAMDKFIIVWTSVIHSTKIEIWKYKFSLSTMHFNFIFSKFCNDLLKFSQNIVKRFKFIISFKKYWSILSFFETNKLYLLWIYFNLYIYKYNNSIFQSNFH